MGKPVLNLEYKYVLYITTATVIFNIGIIWFTILIFSDAIKTKINLGDYINMITGNDGNILPLLLSLPGILTLPLNILSMFLLYKAFGPKRKPKINNMMFIFVLVSCASSCIMIIICIMVLSHSYGAHEDLENGIVEAMQNYSKDSLLKTQIDLLQIQFQCCGSKDFKEWFSIEWYDTNLVKNPVDKQQTPFSCCSIESLFPCIHHGVESTSLPYKYSRELNFSLSSRGCFDAIKAKKKVVGWGITGKIFLLLLLQSLMTVGFRFVQTAHSQQNVFGNQEQLYTAWLIGSHGKRIKKVPPPVPPVPEELQT